MRNRARLRKTSCLHYRAEVDSTWSDVATTRNREKVDKEARSEEMEMKRADNILKHENEILSRPRKTWHQSTGRKSRRELKNEFRENARRVAEEEAEANSKRQNSQRDVHETLQTSADHNGRRQLIVR